MNGAGKAGGMAWRATKQGANAHSTSPMCKPQFGRDKMKTTYNVCKYACCIIFGPCPLPVRAPKHGQWESPTDTSY